MAISIKSNPDGLSGAIQLNGVDTVTINGDGLSLKNLTPVSATAPGMPGTFTHDSEYIYVCVSENVWKRVQLLSW